MPEGGQSGHSSQLPVPPDGGVRDRGHEPAYWDQQVACDTEFVPVLAMLACGPCAECSIQHSEGPYDDGTEWTAGRWGRSERGLVERIKGKSQMTDVGGAATEEQKKKALSTVLPIVQRLSADADSDVKYYATQCVHILQ